jgi:hypothetical protein
VRQQLADAILALAARPHCTHDAVVDVALESTGEDGVYRGDSRFARATKVA